MKPARPAARTRAPRCPTAPCAARGAGGFTLIELLVALALFAVLSVMAYGGLDVVLDGKARVERQARQLAELQKLFLILERDIEQAIDRPVRDEFGDEIAALRGDAAHLEFTRAGWRNPAALRRSHLQRVAYTLDGETLKRTRWSVLDRAPGEARYDSILSEGVTRFELRFLDQGGEWRAYWPAAAVNDGQPAPALPRAIEVGLDIEGWGRITRLFRVAGGRIPAPTGQTP